MRQEAEVDWLKQLRGVVLALCAPNEAIDAVSQAGPPWVFAGVVLTAELLCVAFAYRFVFNVVVAGIPLNVSDATLSSVIRNLRLGGYLIVAEAVIRRLILWYVIAWSLYGMSMVVFHKECDFGPFLALAVLSSWYLVLGEGYTVVIYFIRGVGSFPNVRALDVPVGLNLLTPNARDYWWAFLGHMNVHEAACTLVLGQGFHRITGTRKLISYGLLVTLWIVVIAARAGLPMPAP